MKIAICSDLHLEFGDLFFKNTDNADVLILSGDICKASEVKQYDVYEIMEGSKSSRLHDFFKRCTFQFPHVIYVMGNHEHYDGDFKTTVTKLKTNLSHLKNLYILDKEMKEIDGVKFLGGTMWTDMNNEDPLTLFHIKSVMNDFRVVENSNRVVQRRVPIYEYNADGSLKKDERGYNIPVGHKFKESPASFCPEDSVEDHRKMIDFLKVMTAEKPDDKFVVCTHHTPSFQSCAEYYRSDTIMNGAYHTNLEEFILDRPQIKLWTHGHTHEDFDYMIGDTRVVCNPRGYIKYEKRASNFEVKYVDI
jgi:Icc-related predicted phosphoesterase